MRAHGLRPGMVVVDLSSGWQVVAEVREVAGLVLGVVYASGQVESALGRTFEVPSLRRPDFDRLRAVEAGHVRLVEGRFRDLSPDRHPLHRDVHGPIATLVDVGLVAADSTAVTLTVSGRMLLEAKAAMPV